MAKQPFKKEEAQKILEAKLKSLGALNSIVKGNMFDHGNKDFIPTGIPPVDEALGDIPGFAQGNLVELLGDSGSGKTYVALKAAAEAQKKGLKVAFFNIENSFYEPRALDIGVITRDENLFELIPNLGSGEKMCDIIVAMIESGLYGLVIVDSITALIPEESLSKNFDQPQKIGEHAKLIGHLAKKLTFLCGKHNTTAILINQYRIGAGAQQGTFARKGTGGESLYYYDHYRLSFKKIGKALGTIYNDKKEVIGGKSEITIVKNRYGPPNIQVIFPIYFAADESDPIIDFLMKAKNKYVDLIKESGPKNDKTFSYITEDGEVIESKDIKFLINNLKNIPGPAKKSKNSIPISAFDYICKKIKMDEAAIERLNKKLQSEEPYEAQFLNDLIVEEEDVIDTDESAD